MRSILASLAFAAFATGCSGTPDQVVTGRVATGFPTKVTSVRAVQNGRVLAASTVAVDGSFRLAFAPSPHVALQVVGGGKTHVVFPRRSGGMLTTVSVRANGVPFDLGAITYVGDAASTAIAFHDGPSSETECENGHDSSGAVCVDDDDSDHGTCDDDDQGEDGEHEGEHHDGDGDHAGEADDDVDDNLADEGDAVAEHNFPADGCSDDDGDDDEGPHGDD